MRKILVVDSDVNCCHCIRVVSKPLPLSLVFVDTIKGAKEELSNGQYDIVIVDGYLVDGLGIDLIFWIRHVNCFDVHVVFMSYGYKNAKSFRILRKTFGVTTVFYKPATRDELCLLLSNFDLPLHNQYDNRVYNLLSKIEEIMTKSCDVVGELHAISDKANACGYVKAAELCLQQAEDFTNKGIEEGALYSVLFRSEKLMWNDFFGEVTIALQFGNEYQKEHKIVAIGHKLEEEVYIVEDDFLFVEQLRRQCYGESKFYVQTDPALAIDQLVEITPKVLIVKENYSNTNLRGEDIIEVFRQQRRCFISNTAIGMLVSQGNLRTQIETSYQGVDFFIERTMHMANIFRLIESWRISNDANLFKVLLVADDYNLALKIMALLEETKIKVKTVASTSEVLIEIDKYNPNLLIIDVDLQHYYGLDLLRIIHSDCKYKYLSLIALVGSLNNEMTEQLYLCGVDDFVIKPFNERLFQLKVLNFVQKSAAFSMLCNIDPLTELYNRRAFTELFQKIDSDRQSSLVLIDLNGLKSVNDKYGHDIGDELLMQFAKFLLSSVKDKGFVARWGGDEFVLLLMDMDETDVQGYLQDLFDEWSLQDSVVAQGFSAGIAVYPSDGDDLDTLLNKADASLYQAKNYGHDKMMTTM